MNIIKKNYPLLSAMLYVAVSFTFSHFDYSNATSWGEFVGPIIFGRAGFMILAKEHIKNEKQKTGMIILGIILNLIFLGSIV